MRSEEISALGDQWTPDRMIVIRFPDRVSLDTCFSSQEYRQIMDKRILSVDSRAVIVPGVRERGEENEDM